MSYKKVEPVPCEVAQEPVMLKIVIYLQVSPIELADVRNKAGCRQPILL